MALILHTGPKGGFNPSGDHHTTYQQLEQAIGEVSGSSVTLYFHGGLVAESRGMDSANKFIRYFGTDQSTPICIVWESGLGETLTQRFGDIAKQTIFGWIIKLATKVFNQRTNVHGMMKQNDADICRSLSDHTRQLVDEQAVYDSFLVSAQKVLEEEQDLRFQISASEAEVLDQDKALFGSARTLVKATQVVASSAVRFYKGSNHEVIPTLIEETLRAYYLDKLGESVWSAMKLKTDQMFEQGKKTEKLGTALIDLLSRRQISTGQPIEINLVGHSAGSVAICHLLDMVAIDYPDLTINKVVFVAPAVTAEQAVSSVVNRSALFRDFRMFTMSDEYEKKDDVAFVYSASLLYFISGVLEGETDKALAGMMRFYQDNQFFDRKGVQQWKSFIEQPDHLVQSPTPQDAQDGFKTTYTTHGGFGTDKTTIESIKHFIAS
ncbi:hypothetical protein LYZ37_16630 [Vibrio tubiashii]|uniref:hypothetical protein n=1 Tax=Vibrio tubiashii TaxID=29498 RepID=UPI00234EE0CC|nr:hypothetical protein [Vibrio tubiashii]WCP69644.1 hypothetical protein LYZ37_16630 [Vibrio tubiashii]